MSTRRCFLQHIVLSGALLSAVGPLRSLAGSSSPTVKPKHSARPERPWPPFTTRPVIQARKGVVTAGHYLAAAAGMKMLDLGGNAFDAGVAMGFACAVLEPQYFSLGGEASILIYSAKDKRVWSVSGQGIAPRRATIEWFKSHGMDSIPGSNFLPATVPAVPHAWLTLLERFGTLPLEKVLAPAIELAGDGYPAHLGAIGMVGGALQSRPTMRQAVQPNDHAPRLGEPIRIPGLAATFRKLVEASKKSTSREAGIKAARDAFYKGDIARRILEFGKDAANAGPTGKNFPALLEYEDLASYETPIEDPVTVNYRGYDVYKCGPWCQGPVFLQHLKLLEGYDLQKMGHNSADYIHTVVETAKLAFADRDAYYGDPKFIDVPLDRLLSDEYAAERRRLIDPAKASMDIVPGGGKPSQFKLRNGLSTGHDDTTHLDAIDGDGNMIAMTPSGGWIDASPIIPDLGFPLGVRGQMFWLDPKHPNCLQPGKRPRTTLTPSLVLKDGKPLMVFGTLGGDNQDQWTLQFFLNYVDFGMNLQEAIDVPSLSYNNFFSSWSGHARSTGVSLENRADTASDSKNSTGPWACVGSGAREAELAKVLQELKNRGHNITLGGPWDNGRVLAAAIDPAFGTRQAAASPRGETGYALGW
jgi:gamma-glutamyltranspeptidase / glutathione hydrolase